MLSTHIIGHHNPSLEKAIFLWPRFGIRVHIPAFQPQSAPLPPSLLFERLCADHCPASLLLGIYDSPNTIWTHSEHIAIFLNIALPSSLVGNFLNLHLVYCFNELALIWGLLVRNMVWPSINGINFFPAGFSNFKHNISRNEKQVRVKSMRGIMLVQRRVRVNSSRLHTTKAIQTSLLIHQSHLYFIEFFYSAVALAFAPECCLSGKVHCGDIYPGVFYWIDFLLVIELLCCHNLRDLKNMIWN